MSAEWSVEHSVVHWEQQSAVKLAAMSVVEMVVNLADLMVALLGSL